MKPCRRRERRKGFTFFLTAVVLGGIMPMLGVAIDASFLYTVKAKLSAAVDAAALAGARSLNLGMDMGSQRANAEATATKFFNANFPDGHLGTFNRSVHPVASETDAKTRTVQVTGQVDAPSYFLRFIGIGKTPMKVSGMASRRDVNLVLVLDRSASMSAAMSKMLAAARDFVSKFAEGRDNLALVIFSNGVIPAFPSQAPIQPQSNFKSASPNIDTLISQTRNGGNTNSAGALSTAYQMLQTRNEPGALNLIVFFTDGNPNGVTGIYNTPGIMKAGSTCTYKTDYQNHPMDRGFISRYGGLFDRTGDTVTSVSGSASTFNTSNCYFRTRGTGQIDDDVARMPDTDVYLNATNGPNRYVPVDLTRVTDPNATDAASLNAADDAVRRIRLDTALKVVIYSIGLQGSESPDEVWMKRISNDPTSIYYTSSSPTGMYVKAPTSSDLSNAFAKVASEILRLAL